MIEKNPKDFVPLFFNETSDSYDTIVHWTTFGKDGFWKNNILDMLTTEKTVLDLACGTGILTRQVAKKIPHSEIIGIDITESYLQKARERSRAYPNISYVHQDAEKMDLGGKFDCIMASYLPKYCNPDVLVKNCLEHLNTGGKIILHDFTYPKNKIVRKAWNMYFEILRLEGFFLPSWKSVFVNLPEIIRSTKWTEEYERVMKDNHLTTQIKSLTLGTSAILTGVKISK